MNYRAEWLTTVIEPTWRLTLEFEENGEPFARSYIDCVPDEGMVAHFDLRAREGRPWLRNGLVMDAARSAACRLQHQLLAESGVAQDTLTLGDREKTITVTFTTKRLVPYSGTDTTLYLKDVPGIIGELISNDSETLTPEQRAAAGEFARKELERREGEDEVQQISLSSDDPIHFYIDESGDPGFKEQSSEYYTVAICAVRWSEVGDLQDQLHSVLREQMPPGHKEIKFSSVDRFERRRRDAVYNACIDILDQRRITIFALTVHKEGYINEKIRSQMAVFFYGGDIPDFDGPRSKDNVKDYPKELLGDWIPGVVSGTLVSYLLGQRSTGMVCYDQMNASKNKMLADGFAEGARIGGKMATHMQHVQCDLELPMNLVDSEDYPLIWLSELAARELNRLFAGKDNCIVRFQDSFAGIAPDRGGHYVALVDQHGRYTFFDLQTRSQSLILPD